MSAEAPKTPIVVIQCATPPEFRALHEAFGKHAIEKAGKRQFFMAAQAGVIVLRGAVGKVWAAASAEFAIGRWSPALVIDFGAAGGLDVGDSARLAVGDLVVAEKVIEHDVAAVEGGLPWVPAALGPTFTEVHRLFVENSWIEAAPAYPDFLELEAGLRVTRGRLAAGDKDIQTLEQRRALADGVGAIAATWESSAIGRVCRFHEVPYLSLRVITDLGKDEFLAEYKAGAAHALLPAARAIAQLFPSR